MSTTTRSQAKTPLNSAGKSKKRKAAPAAEEESEVDEEQADGAEENVLTLPDDLVELRKLQEALNGKRELLKAAQRSEARIAKERAKLDRLTSGESFSAEKRAKSAKRQKKSSKRSRKESSSSESGLDSAVSDDDASETSLNMSDEESGSSDSDTDAMPLGKRRKTGKGSRKLDVGSVLSHWRHVAKTLSQDKRAKGEIKSKLRLLYVLRKNITAKGLAAFVEELQFVFIRCTESVVTAERFKINRASSFSTGGALDMKELRAAVRQTAPTGPQLAGTPKNEESTRQTPRAQKKTGAQRWNEWSRSPQSDNTGPAKCYVCNKTGHLARDCSQRVEPKAKKTGK